MTSKLEFVDVATPLGRMILTASAEALVAAYFLDQERPPRVGGDARPAGRHAVLDLAIAALQRYFSGAVPPAGEVPLAAQGTAFQARVWAALRTIGYGQTVSYGAIAMLVAAPRSARAVGAAIGRNPLAIFIPCHRVVGSAGALTGYAGGLMRKRTLLDLERRGATALFGEAA